MPVSTFNVTRRYAAFLSYRHADNREEGRRWAEWLHHALETYEVPRDLIGKTGLRGTPVPASLYPIFRDEEELPADADLTRNIRRALENSDLLIVLCSPRACESRFVREEIQYFKELGKSDRIIALIIDGEPNADDPAKSVQGIKPSMECFPEPLRFGLPVENSNGNTGTAPVIDWTRRVEPIAADVRPNGSVEQGYTSSGAYRASLERTRKYSSGELRRLEKEYTAKLELSRLKLAAGMLAVSLGELTRRDAVYRARRLRRLTSIFGTITLFALLAAAVAIWQRSETEKQRKDAVAARLRAVDAKHAADELINYLQFDLHDTLDTVGRLDLMDGVNSRVRRYQQEHPPEANDPAAQDKVAGDQVIALTQQGDVLLARGKIAEALDLFEQGREIASRLVSKDSENEDWQSSLSNTYQRIGMVKANQGDLVAALENYQRSLAINQRFSAKNPDKGEWLRNLAVSFDKIAEVRKTQGDLPASLENYQQSLAICQRLVAKMPGNADWQNELASNFDNVGDIQHLQGDVADALKSHQQSLDIQKKLVTQNPGNAEWQQNLSVSFEKVGDAQAASGDPAAALESYRQCLAINRKLTTQDAGNARWQRALMISFQKVGLGEQEMNELAGALESVQEGLAISKKLVSENSKNLERQRDLLISFGLVGNMQEAGNDLTSALESYRQSLVISQQLAASDPNNTDLQHDVAVSFNNVGDVQQKQGDFATALESYRQSLASYQKLVARDFTNSGWQYGLSLSFEKIGSVQQMQDDLDGAVESRGQSATIQRQLTRNGSGSVIWLHELAVNLLVIGDIQKVQKHLTDALSSYQEAMSILTNLTKKVSDNLVFLRQLAFSLNGIGVVQISQDHQAEGLENLQRSLDIRNQIANKNPDDARCQIELAYGERYLGLIYSDLDKKPTAHLHFEIYRQVVDRLAEADLSGANGLDGYGVQIERASARALLAGCLDTTTISGRREAHRLYGEAGAILRKFQKSGVLQKDHAAWLQAIEGELRKLKE